MDTVLILIILITKLLWMLLWLLCFVDDYWPDMLPRNRNEIQFRIKTMIKPGLWRCIFVGEASNCKA